MTRSRLQKFEIVGAGLGAFTAVLMPVVGDWPVRLIVLLIFSMVGWLAGLITGLVLKDSGGPR